MSANGSSSGSSVPWARLGLETVVIVFSVLLALILDDWRQDREEQRLVESVSLSLLSELHQNQTVLERRMPYHRAMLDTFNARGERLAEQGGGDLRAIPRDVDLPLLHEMGFSNGLAISPNFARSAWETAVTSGAVNHMDVSVAFSLSAAYEKQEELAETQVRLLDRLEHYHLAAIEGARPVFAVVTFISTLTDLDLRQNELCDWYRIVGRHLGGDDPPEMGQCGSGRVNVR